MNWRDLAKQKRIKNPKLLKEYQGRPCLVCGIPGEAHHVKSKGAGGDDVEENLMPLCRQHHSDLHKFGMSAFTMEHATVTHWLDKNGWRKDEFTKRWIRQTPEGLDPDGV